VIPKNEDQCQAAKKVDSVIALKRHDGRLVNGCRDKEWPKALRAAHRRRRAGWRDSLAIAKPGYYGMSPGIQASPDRWSERSAHL
jgi:hypothetical protein